MTSGETTAIVGATNGWARRETFAFNADFQLPFHVWQAGIQSLEISAKQ